MQPDVLGLLEDILEAIDYIGEDTADLTVGTFVANRRSRQLAERNFEIIGEAMNRICRRAPVVFEQITAARQVIGFRNAVSHGYDVIDYVVMWRTIQESLPVLRDEVEHHLREVDKP